VPERVVQAELLDFLPSGHPDVRRNRRDLRRINALMGNYRWFHRTLQANTRPSDRVLEVGAGDGELGAGLVTRGRPVDGLDRCPRPAIWPAGAAWHCADLRGFDGLGAYDVVYGNLIFHQFKADELAAVGRRLQSGPRLVLACEPTRWRRSQWLFRLFTLAFGANYVSRHDGRVSINAGFLGEELPRLLGFEARDWTWTCRTTRRGAYHLIARRRDAP
jgi:hypothetical protein